jgi:hypothetical protein
MQSNQITDFIQATFDPDRPYADSEMQYYAQQSGLSFSEIIPFFRYLGRGPAKENEKTYYWYQLAKGGLNA